uniref:Chemotaxis protein CheC n=1 Tax=Angiostrongylus cantonensis TaxID=6313 RepID=A0A0K0CYG2_ANGCA
MSIGERLLGIVSRSFEGELAKIEGVTSMSTPLLILRPSTAYSILSRVLMNNGRNDGLRFVIVPGTEI